MTMEMLAMIVAGATIAIGSIGPSLGEARTAASALEAMARQPEAAGVARTTMFLGIAFTEALALIGFVLFFIA